MTAKRYTFRNFLVGYQPKTNANTFLAFVATHKGKISALKQCKKQMTRVTDFNSNNCLGLGPISAMEITHPTRIDPTDKMIGNKYSVLLIDNTHKGQRWEDD